ncbi:MAG: fibronectin type III domain-containing protein [Syntrophobacteraceae bacterium]
MKLKFLAASLLVLCTTLPVEAASVHLAWNPNPGRSVVGYRVHYGIKSGTYTHVITVTGRTRHEVVIKGLKKGETYFFAVTAFNKKGQESPLSTEISGKPAEKKGKSKSGVPAASPPPAQKTSRAKIAPTRVLPTGPSGKVLPARQKRIVEKN